MSVESLKTKNKTNKQTKKKSVTLGKKKKDAFGEPKKKIVTTGEKKVKIRVVNLLRLIISLISTKHTLVEA